MKRNLRLVGSGLLLAASAVVFFGALIITMSDAQGVFVMIFAVPALVVLLGLAIVLARSQSRALFGTAVAWTGFVVLFFVSAPIPVVNAFPKLIMDATGSVFQRYTGETPYIYFKARNDIEGMIRKQLAENGGTQIDFSKMKTGRAFVRVCIFPPYTTLEVAEQHLKQKWDMAAYTKVATDDGIDALVLLDERSITHVVNLLRSTADFAAQGARCLDRAQAVFKHMPGEGNGHVFRN